MATQEQYNAANHAAWVKVQEKISTLGPFEQDVARQHMNMALLVPVVKAAVDAAMTVPAEAVSAVISTPPPHGTGVEERPTPMRPAPIEKEG